MDPRHRLIPRARPTPFVQEAHVRRRSYVALAAAGALAAAAWATTSAAGAAAHRYQRIAGAHGRALLPASSGARTTTAIVELAGKPVSAYQAAALARGDRLSAAERAAIRARIALRQAALAPAIRATGAVITNQLRDAYDGIAVRASRPQLARLATLPGVVAVRPSQLRMPSLVHSVPFIGAPAAWTDLGLTGKGVKIGIIDTGIDYYHADFGGSGKASDFAADDGLTIGTPAFPNAKVAGGYDFVGDNFDPASTDPAKNTPKPDPDPLDCATAKGGDGHGTHVAGIAAGEGVLSDGSTFKGPYNADIYANNTFSVGPGVAPEATLYAYRVFGCTGGTPSSIVAAAIDRAVKDGVNVINMSLGSPYGGGESPDSVAVQNAAQAGVTVVTAAGNESQSAFTVGAPSTTNEAISVAAEDTTENFPGAHLGDAAGLSVSAENANDFTIPDAGITGPLRVLQSAPGTIGLGCDASDYSAVKPGDIVVTRRGVCARTDRVKLGQAAGAAAVIMVNTADTFPPFEGKLQGVTIPFLGVKSSDGPTLLAADGATVTVTPSAIIANPSFTQLAGFTSGGPRTGDNALKPDVTAPGVGIASALVGSGDQAQNLSGTSMASPHTAGVAALVKQAHPAWTPATIKAAIMGTASADPKLLSQTDVRVAGAGLVNPREAVDTVAWATTASGLDNLSFGYDPLRGPLVETRTFRISNSSDTPITYGLASAFDGDALGATASLSAPSVTVPAHGCAPVSLTLSMGPAAVAALPPASDAAAPGTIASVGGVVTATPTATGPGVYPLRVPFLAVPRGLSNVRAGRLSPLTPDAAGLLEGTVGLSNIGLHPGTADVYSWGLSDPRDSDQSEMDIRNVGVQSLPGEAAGAPASDRLLVFAVNIYGRWSNAAGNEFDIPIDTNGDGKTDFTVVGTDLGAVTAGDANGQMASFVVDAEGNIVDAFNADAPMNGSTVLLPALASDLGLSAPDSKLTYGAVGFDLREDHTATDQVDGTATFAPFSPAQSTGDFLALQPGDHASLGLTVDPTRFQDAPSKGWLIVSLDDPNGGAQAAEVPVSLPNS
jgi:subtilisin family serine protease